MTQSLRGLLTSYSNHRRLLTLGAAHTDILQLAGYADCHTKHVHAVIESFNVFVG